jgi:formamidopyrimidine-DNA glycosylase
MPELPEVQTTVNGLNKTVIGLKITDAWSSLPKKSHIRKDEIKNLDFWNKFKKEIIGQKITKVERHGKNILIHLNKSKTVLVHMKMTGHLLYGKYRVGLKSDGKETETWPWWPEDKKLQDPYNRFIRVLFSLNNGYSLAFCDSRKFGKVTIFETDESKNTKHLKDLGTDALDPKMTYSLFKSLLLKRPTGRIKNVLMDQTIITGIGNIYSDEILWESGVNPKELVRNIPETKISAMYKSIKPLLKRGINFGGDSTSDYRNVFGEKGRFQNKHHVYRKTGLPCERVGCKGVIIREVVGGRSAHFCSVHQPYIGSKKK